MGLFGKFFGSKQPVPFCAIHPADRSLVRGEDAEWWSSLSLDDCKSLEHQDNVTRVAALQKFMDDDGLAEEDAGTKVRLQFPLYYSTLQQRAADDFEPFPWDAKLPYVLKNRVNRALTSGAIDQTALGRTSSMNALIRLLIRAGRL